MVKRKRNQIVLRKKNQIIIRGGGEWINPLSQIFSSIGSFFSNFFGLFSNFIISMNPLNWSSVQAIREKSNEVIDSAKKGITDGKESFNSFKSSVSEKVESIKEKATSADKKIEDKFYNISGSNDKNKKEYSFGKGGGYRKKTHTKKRKKKRTKRRKQKLKKKITIKRSRRIRSAKKIN